jgi:transposase
LRLDAFYGAIRAREGGPGRPPIDPKILIALWLYATIDGVGSARELDRLCQQHDAYRWIRGGVSVNHHTLSDFRVAHQAALHDLLTQSIAALIKRQVITLTRVAQDGTRVRASAGLRSFRRRPTLEEALRVARQQVERTARQEDGAALSRQAAAQARAAAEQVARVDAALAEMPLVEAAKARNKSTAAPRVSTTDPEARRMKMTDGGYRPAYNVQLATDVDGRAIVGVSVSNVGCDQTELLPMLDQIIERTGRAPTDALVDGGFVTLDGITTAAAHGVTIYAPVPKPRGDRDRAAACPGDSPAVAAWRARMASDDAKAIYKARAATAEWINADARTHRTLGPLLVRGLQKVHTWVLWIAVAHNMMRTMGIVPHHMM